MGDSLKREILGIALILLAVFLIGAFALQAVPASADVSCTEVRGVFGPVGACLKAWIFHLMGAPAAWLIALLPLLHGLRLLDRLPEQTDRRWLQFVLGLAVLLPVGIGLASDRPNQSGGPAGLIWGFVAFYLDKAFGTAGAWIVLALLGSALMAWTLRWNPIRAIIGPGSRAPRAVSPTLATALEPPPEEMPAVEGYRGAAVTGEEGPAEAPGRARRERKPRPEVQHQLPPPDEAAAFPELLVPDEHAIEDVLPQQIS
jgi:S-DNA-T family DNA segregation ATPase FtsK/SpoIIIE